MSDRDFMKYFSYMLGTMAALAVVVFIIAQIVSSNSTNSLAEAKEKKADDTTIANRMKPAGKVLVRATTGTMNSIIPVANAADSGKGTYDSACAACHGAGVAGAPKLGDKAAWKARIAQGNDTLYSHAIKGFAGKKGFMPPKGGNAALSDAAVKASVDYMVNKSK